MDGRETLRSLIMEVFLLEESEFSFELTREQIPTWDSLGTVSLAVGIQETFKFHMTQEEALAIHGVGDIVALLQSRGIPLDDPSTGP